MTVEPLTDSTSIGTALSVETEEPLIVRYEPTMGIGPPSQLPEIVRTEPFPE